MTLDDCIEYYEDTGNPYFKTYDDQFLEILLTLKYNHPHSIEEHYTREVEGDMGFVHLPIAYFDGGDNWEVY